MPTAPPSPPPARSRSRRPVACLVLISIVATLFAAFAASPANAAAANSFQYKDGTTSKIFGPNTTVMIDGTLRYDDQCVLDSAIKDFFYPATDVYVVPTGSVGANLQNLIDIGGAEPNTVIGVGDGTFLDEIIGFTSPAGKIPAGTYDLVFDTCQDGFFSSGDDVFRQAITVRLPEVLPPVSSSIAALKENARLQSIEWLKFHFLMQVVLNIDKIKEVAACMIAPTPVCLMMVLAVIFDEAHLGNRQGGGITDLAPLLVMNVAKNHGAIWKDPADPAFEKLPVLTRPDDGDLPATGQDLADGFAGLLPALADEAALTDALLHALERYQGAQQAGDGEWALAQARAASDLSATLADHLSTSDAIGDLRDAITGTPGLTEALAEGAALGNRIRTSGFEADEIQALRNQGLSTADIVELEGQFVRAGFLPTFSATDLVDQLDALADARADMVTALDASTAGWNAVAGSLDHAGRTSPSADAGGPYTAAAGQQLVLDGSGSTAAAGAQLTDVDWDIDGDGAFDDATGATPSVAVSDQTRLVSLRVTDDAGRQAVAHAVVTTSTGDRPPVVASTGPARASTVVVGDDVTFSVDATDPEGEALTHAWTLDGEPAGDDSAAFTWTPGADDLGTHTVKVTVADGTTRGTLAAWRVTVTPEDADGDGWVVGVDCDDTRADRSPSTVERLGNGLDDDCDASTPDAPPGGLTGAVWSWGYSEAVGTGTFDDQYSPVPVPGLSEVVRVASNRATAFAVLPSGQVRAWGQNHRGMLGDGTGESRRKPVTVVGLDGQEALTDVVQVDSESMHTVAVQSGGAVVAWGNNANGQSGDGSTSSENRRPVRVRTADGNPLTGAVAVDAGESESYALLGNGSVVGWGTARCGGTYPHAVNRTATPLPFGSGGVQIVAGGLVMLRKADGSVWSCGGDAELLDRGKGLQGHEIATPAPMRSFGPGSDVIDVSAGGDAAVALKADGSVWLWGRNTNGSINPITTNQSELVESPTKVALPPGAPVIDVEMDDTCHGYAVRADGSVLAWGCNLHGATGVGSQSNPVQGLHVLDLGGNAAHAASASAWNGHVLVRPLDDPAVVRPAPWITVSAEDASIIEGTDGSAGITLSAPALDDVEVTYAIGTGAATKTTIPAGETGTSVPVPVRDDTLDEEDEELSLHVLAVSDGLTIERRTSVLTIVDDDDPPVVSVTGVTIPEGDTSLTDVKVTVELSQESGKDVEVLWSTEDGTAISPADFGAASGHILIPAGTLEMSFHLAVVGDHDVEAHEQLLVALTEPVHAELGQARAAITITDDEPIVVQASEAAVTEGDSGTTDATFTVSATVPPGTSVSLPWSVKPGSAELGVDVETTGDTLTLEHGSASQTLTVPVIGDTVVEGTEVFRLAFGDAVATNGRRVVVGEAAVGVILDDDVAGDPDPDPDPEPDPDPVPVFDFDGFFQPVDNLPAVNTVQPGRSIPVKFSLGGDHGLDIFEAGHPLSRRVACESGAPADSIEQTVSPGSSELTYDPVEDRYQYVWKTEKGWKGQCRELVVRFVDGTEATAMFRFK